MKNRRNYDMNAGRKVVFHKNNMCNRSIYKLHTGFYPRNLGRIGAAVSEQAAGLAPRARTHIFGEARERTEKSKNQKKRTTSCRQKSGMGTAAAHARSLCGTAAHVLKD